MLNGYDPLAESERPRPYLLHVYGERPLLLNEERKLHPKERARVVKRWREAFALEAMASGMPRPLPGPIDVGVLPILQYRYKQDVGACFPTAKAAIDGLVDAGFLPNDTPEWVRSVKFLAPLIGQEESGIVLSIFVHRPPGVGD